jgi:hypothetical protein
MDRRVYMFIFVVYRITYVMGLAGYGLLMLEIFGVSSWLSNTTSGWFSVKLVRISSLPPHLTSPPLHSAPFVSGQLTD